MGGGFNRSGALVLVAVTAFCQLAGCAGRAATKSGSENSAAGLSGAGLSNAGASGSVSTIASGGAGAGGTESQTIPDGCNSDPFMRLALAGQPCPKAGEPCGAGDAGECTVSCSCTVGDAGALT